MARAKKLEQNLILVELIEKWANKYGFRSDPYLQKLSESLITKDKLGLWASVDPLELLPEPQSKSGDKYRRIAKICTLWRNALVFAPVAFTWLAVGRATAAFQIYTDENINATVNFLQFWQNGYGVLDEKWRIGTVAATDAGIVFVVILLTILITFSSSKAREISQLEQEVMKKERTMLALAIKEYLFTKQNISRLTLNQGVATAIENLVEATEKLKYRRRR
jgi:hypothetical protein